MFRRRPAAPDYAKAYPLPPGILPRDFIARHDLVRRLFLDPFINLTPPHAWAPMTDAEWDAIRPFLVQHRCGLAEHPRAGVKMQDVRGRLDAVFRGVTRKRAADGGRASWRTLPAEFGKADTVSRTYRRWCHQDLWMRLLMEVAAEDCAPALAAFRYRICCAFRRAIRMIGLRGIILARRLRLFSALPAPSLWLPDPDLSEIFLPVLLGIVRHARATPGWRFGPERLRTMQDMHRVMGGRTRISWRMEPP